MSWDFYGSKKLIWGSRDKAYFISQRCKSLASTSDLKYGGLDKNTDSKQHFYPLATFRKVAVMTSQADS